MRERAIFGAGCFWGVQERFSALPGVLATTVGYAGGALPQPTYDAVCSGTSGHTEVVQVEFDPTVLTYQTLVETFFALHDPTQLNRQGPDIGHQYRSVIHCFDGAQEATARVVRTALTAANRYAHPIVTAIEPAVTFWPAEAYHQHYFKKNGGGGCHG
jgi:peptide-methionine (S)-S-oxide reductase